MKPVWIFSFLSVISLVSCKKFLQVGQPQNLITSAAVYSGDATATAVVTGMYGQMVNSGGFASGGNSSVTLLSGMSADDFFNYATDPTSLGFYTNSLSTQNFAVNLWSDPYQYIGICNAVIEGLQNSPGVTTATRNELTGEAKFTRAFCNYYLTALFGDVPLVTSTDYKVNQLLARVPSNTVYRQIISDLKDAQNLCDSDFSFSGGERDRPNKWAATALLARIYLNTGAYDSAEAEATSVIGNTNIYNLVSNPDSVFLANSTEAIWQLKPMGDVMNTNEGFLFILLGDPAYVSLSTSLLNAFEPGDTRRLKWVNSFNDGTNTYYYPFKYKIQYGNTPFNEYSMVLRLSEQYLIRAEARAMQSNTAGAQADLNIIRARAGLLGTAAVSLPDLIAAILRERRVELFSEWGHRWLDLKRTGIIDAVMDSADNWKGGSWQTYQQLYPIPQMDIAADKNIKQNSGY